MNHLNTPAVDHSNILPTSFANADLDSASATQTPTFVFPTSVQKQSPITLLRCSDVSQTCLRIKDWLLRSFNNDMLATPGILRMEKQDLHLVPPGQHGWLLLAENAALIKSADSVSTGSRPPVAIMAVLRPRDSRVRWFYSLLPIATLLRRLDSLQLIQLHRSWQPGSAKHKRFFTYIREGFTAATTIPHAPDFINAEQMTDYCPSILEPDTALQRLEQNEFIYFSVRNNEANNRDLSDDRYLLNLHPAEREVASIADLQCSAYMLIKRSFFARFYEEIYRSDKKIDPEASAFAVTTSTPYQHDVSDSAEASRQSSVVSPSRAVTPNRRKSEREAEQTPPPSDSARRGGARYSVRNRVRSEHAHKEWLEREHGFKSSRAKMLVTAWRELGFLDEGRYLDWVRAGGMLENAELGGDARGEDNVIDVD